MCIRDRYDWPSHLVKLPMYLVIMVASSDEKADIRTLTDVSLLA